MALDPSISLAVRPPQFNIQIPQPLEQFGQVLSLQGLMQEQGLRALQQQQAQLQLQQLRTQVQEQQNLADLFRNVYGGSTALPAQLQPTVPAQPSVAPVPTQPVVPAQPSLFSVPSGTGIAGVPVQPPVAGVPQDAFWRPESTVIPTFSQTPSPATPATTVAPVQSAAPLVAPQQPEFPSTAQILRAAPISGMATVKALTDAQIAQANLVEKQLAVHKAESGAMGSMVNGITDDESLKRNLPIAVRKGWIQSPEASQIMSQGYDDPRTQRWLEEKQKQALTYDQNVDLAIKQNDEKRKQWLFPYQLSDAQQGTIQKTLATQNDQRSNDASMLYAAASRGPQALDVALSSLPADRRFPFLGVTSDKPQDILIRGLKPSEAQTASETIRQHGITNLIDAGKFNLEKQKNDAMYGPGTAESWAATLYTNPDAEAKVPADVRNATQQVLRQKYGLPWPTELKGQESTQETSSRSTLDAITRIRQKLQNPEIAKNIGPIMGNLGNIEQATGVAAGLSPDAARQAQELRTDMRFLLANEVGSLRARLNKGTMDALQQSSPRTNMDIDMLKGALDGVEDNTNTTLDSLERKRWGGQYMRPREVRGLGAGIPQATRDALIKAGAGRHQGNDGQWYQVGTDGSVQAIPTPAEARQK